MKKSIIQDSEYFLYREKLYSMAKKQIRERKNMFSKGQNKKRIDDIIIDLRKNINEEKIIMDLIKKSDKSYLFSEVRFYDLLLKYETNGKNPVEIFDFVNHIAWLWPLRTISRKPEIELTSEKYNIVKEFYREIGVNISLPFTDQNLIHYKNIKNII
jgi:hypothetical protein